MQKCSTVMLITGILFFLLGMLSAWNLLTLGLDTWVYLGLGSFLSEFLSAVVSFAAGAAGIRNWKKPKKASTCFVIGLVSFSFFVMSVIGGWLYDPLSRIEFLLLNVVIQIALTGLHMTYILAAYKFAKSSHDISSLPN